MYEEPILRPVLAISGLGVLIALSWLFLAARKYRVPENIRGIADDIRISAWRVLHRELVIGWLVALALGLTLSRHGGWVANGLAMGVVLSSLAACFGLTVSVRANAYTATAGQDARSLLTPSSQGGSAVGVMTVSLALASIAGMLLFMRVKAIPAEDAMLGAFGLALGGSVMSLVLRIAGGISSRVNQGAGNLEPGLAHSHRLTGDGTAQPASVHIDGAAMSTDIFATYLLTMVASVWLAHNAFGVDSLWMEFPLVVAGVALGATIASGLLVPSGRKQRIIGTLYLGAILALLLAAGGLFFGIEWFLQLPGVTPILDAVNLFGIVAIGLALLPIIAVITEYYTAKGFAPARKVARASETGVATNIIAGLSVGMNATLMPILAITGALSMAYYLGGGFSGNSAGGFFGIVLAIVALVSVAGTMGSFDAFGSIAKSARDIHELTSIATDLNHGANALSNAGQITQSVAKGYTLASMTLASLLLLVCYTRSFSGPMALELNNPLTLLSLLAGGLLTYWFGGQLLGAIGKLSNRTHQAVNAPATSGSHYMYMAPPGMSMKSGSARFSNLGLTYSIVLMAFAPLAITVGVGLLLGRQVLAGVLLGSLVVGLLQAMTLTSSGGVWNSARRRIDEGSSGGPSSGAHKASIAGDTVGNPCKQALGPAMGSMINTLFLTALLIAPLLAL